jgi:hypothetical protein
MWRMQDGNRVLTEAEWALFRVGLEMLRDYIEDAGKDGCDLSQTDVHVFDVLQKEQKLALLADVAEALRDPAIAMPRHTAANEGTVAAVFAVLRQGLEMEFAFAHDQDASTEIRSLLLAAAVDAEEQPEDLPALEDEDGEEWGWVLETVEDRILWDADYEMCDEFLDQPPEAAQQLHLLAGVEPDYFTAIPREPDESGMIAVRQTLARLLGTPVSDGAGHYLALMDLYHDLVIGPCSPREIEAWEHHPWIEVRMYAEPSWDCDYATWVAKFRDALPTAPFDLDAADSGEVEAGELCEVRVEQQGDAWVIRDDQGSLWCDALTNCWTDNPDEEVAALTFSSGAEARAAYLRADRMYVERATRRKAAMARLDPHREDA